MKLCEDTVADTDMMEKTFYTFNSSNVVLQQKYREKGSEMYFELISHLVVPEKTNDLLINHFLK